MKKGFTLIELLVVVLIIGILASIAVPQYTKIVFQTKMKKFINGPIMHVFNSLERYKAIHGTLPVSPIPTGESSPLGKGYLDISFNTKDEYDCSELISNNNTLTYVACTFPDDGWFRVDAIKQAGQPEKTFMMDINYSKETYPRIRFYWFSDGKAGCQPSGLPQKYCDYGEQVIKEVAPWPITSFVIN